MRVALVGWDIDDPIAGSLSALGVDLVAFTRWFSGQSRREGSGGWTRIRCPMRLSGDPATEARDFATAVVRYASEMGFAPEFDVIHSVDRMGRLGGVALAERSPGSALVASVAGPDVVETWPAVVASPAVTWICNHPWVADRWRERVAENDPIRTILTGRSATGRNGATPTARVEHGPLFVLWVPGEASIDPEAVAEAVEQARAWSPGLRTVVLGTGPLADALRRQLTLTGLIAPDSMGRANHSLESWERWVGRATVLGVAAERLADDPAALLAWLGGIPVVGIVGSSRRIAESCREAVYSPARRTGDLRVTSVLARRAFEPANVAAGWARVYVEAIERPRAPEPPDQDRLPLAPAAARSKLTLVATGEQEADASWSVWPGDWSTALEWLGPDAIRASLVLRLADVTDIRFQGANAHAIWDLDLSPGDSHRTVRLNAPGRSLASCLGVRSAQGVFLPIAYARLCHLPREREAPELPTRRHSVLPRLGGP